MLKKPLSFHDQVSQLDSHNISVSNIGETIDTLSIINYYRLSGYALSYRTKPSDSDCKEGTRFEDIFRLYCFDQDLRTLLRKYLEIAEVYYKTQIAHWFSLIKCIQPPHNQHYDRKNYHRKTDFDEIIKRFQKQRNYYKDSLIVKHHDKKYGGQMPLWVIVELLSFSNASKLYSSMYASEQDAIASHIGISRHTLKNHLHCMAILRNKCSHGARLYNTTLYPSVKMTPSFLKKHPDVHQDTVFSYMLMLIKRLPRKEDKISFKNDIEELIKNYINDIDLTLIGFPVDYEKILNNNC